MIARATCPVFIIVPIFNIMGLLRGGVSNNELNAKVMFYNRRLSPGSLLTYCGCHCDYLLDLTERNSD